MIARGYVRVSTDEQARNGASIPSQTKILEAQALIKGYDDFKVYVDDGFSGKSLQRPAVQQLLRECREGHVDVIIVWKLDRLSRSLRDILTLIEDDFTPKGIALISATESIDTSTPAGRAMLSVLGTFAQFEREQDAERVSMVHKALAKDCRFLGGPVPLGYKIVDKHYAIDEDTAPIVRHIFQMYIHREGYAAILAYMERMGVTTAFGRPYTKSTLNHLLGNERYNGTYIHNRLSAADSSGHRSSTSFKPEEEQIRIPGGIPAIIDMPTWEAACAIRAENRVYSGRQSTRARFMLAGMCRCKVCGEPMYVDCGGTDRNGTRQRYYICRRRCISPARKEKLEAAAHDVLTYLASNPALVNRACDTANELARQRTATHADELAALRTEHATITARIATLTKALVASDMTAPQAALAAIAELESKQRTLSARIAALDSPTAYTAKSFLAAINSVLSIKKEPSEELQTLIQTAFAQITISQNDYTFILHGNCAVEMRGVDIKAIIKRGFSGIKSAPIKIDVTYDAFDTKNIPTLYAQ